VTAHVVDMSPHARTDTVPPGATRTCISCKRTRTLDAFALIDPGAGTIDRRRVCTVCLTAVDELLRSGNTNLTDISRRTGVSTPTIRQRRDELGVTGRGYRRLNDIDALTELTLANHDPAVIADQLNVEVHTVRRRQVDLGLREPDARFRRTDDSVLARAEQMLREERASYSETARTVGVDVDTLRRHFPGLGWTADDFATMASILSTPELRRLHVELFGASTP